MLTSISFIIPCFNEAALLPSCVAAIREAIDCFEESSGGPLNSEIVVVDNNSTDQTALIAAGLGVRVIKAPTQGLTHARQAGMLAAKYGLHAYIDADNRIPQYWLKLLSLLFSRDCVAISGPVWFDEQGWFAHGCATAFLHLQEICHRRIGVTIQGGNFAVRRDALILAGGHSVNVDFYGEDTDLAVRLSHVGRVDFERRLWCNTSARRFLAQGYLSTTFTYALNYFSVHWLGRPLTKTHVDYRTAR